MSTNPVQLLSAMPSRRFLKPWSVEPMPSGYRVIDANGLALAHINGEPQNAVVPSPNRLSDDEVRRIAKWSPGCLIWSSSSAIGTGRSRHKPQALHFKPVTIGVGVCRAGDTQTAITQSRMGEKFAAMSTEQPAPKGLRRGKAQWLKPEIRVRLSISRPRAHCGMRRSSSC